jgi:hypothetical protein
MGIRSCAAGAALAFAGVFIVQPALAEGACPAPDDAPLVGAVDPQRRLDFLAKAFDEEVRETDTWSWTLGSVFTAGGVAQAAVLPIYKHDRATSIDLTVGAISFGIGAVSLWGLPLQITLPLRSARRHWGDADRCAVLANAERTLVSIEKEEARETGIIPHIANVVVNTAAILILGLGYGHGQQAAFSGGIGISLGEANAFSQPHNLRSVLLQYRSGELDQPPPAPTVSWSVVPMTTPQTAGAGVALSW